MRTLVVIFTALFLSACSDYLGAKPILSEPKIAESLEIIVNDSKGGSTTEKVSVDPTATVKYGFLEDDIEVIDFDVVSLN